MNKRTLNLILLALLIASLSCFSQNHIKMQEDHSVKIICLRDSIPKRGVDYSIPDIGGCNEKNIYNKTIIEDFYDLYNFDDSIIQWNNPKDFLKEIIQHVINHNGICNFLAFSEYDVNYNHSFLLSIAMHYVGYSFNNSYFNFDIQNQTILTMEDIIQEQKMPMLLDTINQILKLRVLAYEQDSTENNKEQHDNNYTQDILKSILDSYPDGKYFTQDNFYAFQLKEEGIWIYYDYDLDRVTSCPDWNLFFTYEELKPYIKKEFIQRMVL